MTYAVLFRHSAERDAERAQDWYALHAPDQEARFIDDLAATVDLIRRSPHAFRTLRQDARRAAMKVFPYMIWYRVHEDRRIIEVIAVVHGRQDGERLQDRLA